MALQEPSIPPAFYGEFAEEISLYYCCTSADKRTYHMFLSDTSSAESATPKLEGEWMEDSYDPEDGEVSSSHMQNIRPKYAVEIQPGITKHQITLRSGTSGHDPPLALAGNESSYRTMPIVALPPILENAVRNRTIPIDHSSKSKNETWTFAAHTSAIKFLENFQWRTTSSPDDTKQTACPRTLVHLGSSWETKEETVAIWTPESTLINCDTSEDGEHIGSPRIKYGTLRFVGAGQGQGLGAYWRLMVVITMLRINQERWDNLSPVGPVDAMRMRVRKVFGVSVDVGMGMLGSGSWAS